MVVDRRRGNTRIRIKQRINVQLSSGEWVQLWSYDISQAGIQVLSNFTADVGDEFDVFLNILNAENDDYVRVDIRVKLIHVLYDSAEECFRIGMDFLNFKGDGQAIYEHYFDSRLRASYDRLGSS
jgi:c-di-GMP-binding flagellar brake protein YcgR